MSLTDKINADIKAAMLAKEKEKLAVLRAVKSALLLEATKGSGDVTDDAEMKILQKLHKQRKEAADIYVEQGREDLAGEENFQASIIETYLPEQMGEDEIRAVVREVIAQTGASSPADMGKVMGAAMGKLSGKADGKLISSIVKEALVG